MVLAKFGYELKNKIVHTIIGIDDEIFDIIDKFREDPTDLNFVRKYNIQENKLRITIGYSGNLYCNHLLILDELEKIEQKTKDKIHLLVPMTYGNFSRVYMEDVKLKLNQTKISYTLFDKFLSLEELAKLRLISNVMIMMNETDGFSASIAEALYADNILISAIWLPYSLLRLENIFLYETDFAKLNESVTFVVNNYEKLKINLTNNPNKARKLKAFSQNWQRWISIINFLQ